MDPDENTDTPFLPAGHPVLSRTSPRTSRTLGLGAAVALLGSMLTLSAAAPAVAQGTPFRCDPGFYQVISGQLAEFDPATEQYDRIGPDGPNFNAVGYRPADGFLYGMQGTTLLRIDQTGAISELAKLDVPSGAYTGDFYDDGRLHISRGGQSWYAVDVDTYELEAFPELSGSYSVADITNVNGKFYGVSGRGDLVIFDPIAREVIKGGTVTGLVGSGSFGAAWSTSGGNLYVGRNSGHLFQIAGYSKGTPHATLLATGESTRSNDGASCPYAPPPPGIPDVDGPEPETQPSTPEGQAAQQTYEEEEYVEPEPTPSPESQGPTSEPAAAPTAAPTETPQESQQTYEIADAGLGAGASCEPGADEDRLPRALVDATQVSEPTVLFSSDFDDGFADYLVLSGSWEVSGSALRQLNACGFDYTALLKTPPVEHFRFGTTFSGVDLGPNNGGMIINQSHEDTRSGALLIDLADGGTVLRWGSYDATGYYNYLGSTEVDGTGSAALEVEVHGTKVQIFFNGAEIVTVETPNPGGHVGLLSSQAAVAFHAAELVALPAS